MAEIRNENVLQVGEERKLGKFLISRRDRLIRSNVSQPIGWRNLGFDSVITCSRFLSRLQHVVDM